MMRYLLAALLFVVAPATLRAEPGGVRTATYDQLDVPRAVEQVRFEKRPTRPGDRVDQDIQITLALESTVRQEEQVVDTHSRKMERMQQRAMIAEEVVEGRTVSARVRFLKSERQTEDKEAEVHPVVGKTYVCRRPEDQPLQITRDDGSIPGPEEFQIVSESMDALGRPNPLADFFAGRSISIGEKIVLPEEIGARLLGSGGGLGKVSRFELTLVEVVQHEGARVARFAADLEALGEEGQQMRLVVSGTIDLEVDTCRTRQLELSGPLAMATNLGSYSQTETTQVSGKLRVQMSAEYNDR